jgi:hypothetical protein
MIRIGRGGGQEAETETGDRATETATETETGDGAAGTGAAGDGTDEAAAKTTPTIPISCRWAAAKAGATKRRKIDGGIVTIGTTVATIGVTVAAAIGMIAVTGIAMIVTRSVMIGIGTIGKSPVERTRVMTRRMTTGRSTSATTMTTTEAGASTKSRRHPVGTVATTTTMMTMTVTVASGKSPKSPAVTIMTMTTTAANRPIIRRLKRNARIATGRGISHESESDIVTRRSRESGPPTARRKSRDGRRIPRQRRGRCRRSPTGVSGTARGRRGTGAVPQPQGAATMVDTTIDRRQETRQQAKGP